ncbi:MAG TPA: FlgO family outer membrane protein [Elusimicrobiales bacterium]|nr:FlgO family outer membrane protein [Elusimicrobiales bacterium]
MYELKKDLKSKMFNKTDKKILKIAVLNFKDIGEDAAKSKAGEIVSSALSKHFINDKDFVFVERNRLDKILEELRLNMLGIIDEKDIKRVGLILGVDWLVIGEVSSVGNEFSVNARVANSETAEVIAASNINIDKEVLLKESSELYNLSKNYFNITGGAINFSDLNLKASSFGLEWRHNYSRKNYIKFSFKKSSNNSDLLDKKFISKWNIFDSVNPADDLYVE